MGKTPDQIKIAKLQKQVDKLIKRVTELENINKHGTYMKEFEDMLDKALPCGKWPTPDDFLVYDQAYKWHPSKFWWMNAPTCSNGVNNV
jgi:hypothetical protein